MPAGTLKLGTGPGGIKSEYEKTEWEQEKEP